jgi:hypothetical protein
MAAIASGESDLPAYRARSYQLEMFEASLKDNIIVAVCDNKRVQKSINGSRWAREVEKHTCTYIPGGTVVDLYLSRT